MIEILLFLVVILLWAISSSVNRLAKWTKIRIEFDILGTLPPLLAVRYEEMEKEESKKVDTKEEDTKEEEQEEKPLEVDFK